MSEEERAKLEKLEKLEKRRQQLLKWKLKKSAEESEPKESPGDGARSASSETSSEVDQKKLERQRKLEEWKRKKQLVQLALALPLPHPEQRSRSPDLAQPDKSDKTDEGVLRINAWKKRKIDSGTQSLKPIKTNGFALSLHRERRNVLDSEEDEEEETGPVPQFKAPTIPLGAPNGTKSKYNRTGGESASHKQKKIDAQEDGDELDMFLESLEVPEVPLKANLTEKTPNSGTFGNLPVSILGADFSNHSEESSDEDEDDRLLLAKMKSLSKGKELAKVDHEQIEYEQFRKDFYSEARDVKALTSEEVKGLRLELDGIKVSGQNVPNPIWEWSHLGLSPLVLSIVEDKLSFKKPTSVQSQALPAIMSGRDFMGVAKTGSGKTLAFVLPLLGHVQAQSPLAKGDGPIAVLLTPTRELALQTYKQLSYFTKKLGLTACCCYGGSSIEPQIAELKKGSQIVVATPGRLIDLLAANNGRVCNLRRVTYIVLDEADRMFDFGFEPQVTKIFSQIRPDRQSILFSATFAKKMESLARAILRDPVEVVVGGISVVAPEITQHIEFFSVEEGDSADSVFDRKLAKLSEVLKAYPEAKKLVFVEKQESADALLVKLLAQRIPCVAIHGGKEQIDRKYAIREFSNKESAVDVLIATSIAARGLDVKGLDLVVNFDPANHMEDYVHRVGRTGRAGNHGDAYTFVTSEQERPITDLVKALRLSKVPDGDIDPRLLTISSGFLEKVKEGKEKFRFGFGGNGLDKLDETRSSTKVLERKAYEVDPEPKQTHVTKTGTTAVSAPNGKASTEAAIELPEFKVIEGRAEETAGPDKCKFHSRVTINDLPQKARWTVVSADNLSQIIEATSTSITNKGQYYPPKAKIPPTIKQGGREVPAPPKLYLLIEGLTEASVSEANRLIRQKMIEGLEHASADEAVAAPGKYTV